MRAAVVASVLALAVAQPASAQDNKKEAERFFRAGERSFNKGEYLLAAQAFEEAYRRFQSPAIAFSAAQAYRLQYFDQKEPAHLKRAVELYRSYLEAVSSGGRRADAVASLAELEPILQRMEETSTIAEAVAPATVTKLLISSQIEAAQVRVNGASPKPMPLAMEVSPGKYRIQVELPGYFPFDETREVFEGQFRVVEIELVPRPALLSLKTARGASVVVDGRSSGRAPLSRPIELPAGKHLVAVRRRGHRLFVRELEVERGQAVELDAELEMTLQRKLSYAVLGTAGVGFATSGLFLLAAGSSDSKASDLLAIRDSQGLTLDEAERYKRLRNQRNDRVRASIIFAGAAAAIGAAGALLYYLDTPETTERTSSAGTVTPIAGPGQVGVGYSGNF